MPPSSLSFRLNPLGDCDTLERRDGNKQKVEPIKVLMINQHFYHEIAATAQIMSDLAKHLTTKGMQVTILTGQPSYLPGAPKISPKEVYQGITIYRVPNTNFSRSNLLGRISNYLTF